jgi:hypothetical protein
LIGVYGEQFLPCDFSYSDSLGAFRAYYVNKFIDYYANEIAFEIAHLAYLHFFFSVSYSVLQCLTCLEMYLKILQKS